MFIEVVFPRHLGLTCPSVCGKNFNYESFGLKWNIVRLQLPTDPLKMYLIQKNVSPISISIFFLYGFSDIETSIVEFEVLFS
jgi:hypothetical protein